MSSPVEPGILGEWSVTVPASDTTLDMEWFESAAPGPHPAVFLLHGAAALTQSGPAYHAFARALACRGYTALLVRYLGGRVAAGAINAESFARWTRLIGAGVGAVARDRRIDARRMGMVGVSLGAYLALAVTSQDARIRAVVECCGGFPERLPDEPDVMPPTLVLHGEDDTVVPVAEAHKLMRLYEARGWPYEAHIYTGHGHSFMGAAPADALDRALDFFDRHLKPGSGQGTDDD